MAEQLSVRPTKTLGQNFVHDANTVRKIVAAAQVGPSDVALEVGPGLGSLTLALLGVAGSVIAVEIDPVLADRLPETVAQRAPGREFTLIQADAMKVGRADLPAAPTSLVANLPYNVAVPVLLHMLTEFPSITTSLVMVQLEVAQRLAAEPGSKTYGVPSVKARFFGRVSQAGRVGASVFWPEPKVESGLVRIDRYQQAPWPTDDNFRRTVFAIVDAAFAQRRKTLRSALRSLAGSAEAAQQWLADAGIDPMLRGERLDIDGYVALARSCSVNLHPASR